MLDPIKSLCNSNKYDERYAGRKEEQHRQQPSA
jgi:hypothetical protein